MYVDRETEMELSASSFYFDDRTIVDEGNVGIVYNNDQELFSNVLTGDEYLTLVRVRHVASFGPTNPYQMRLSEVARLVNRTESVLRKHLRAILDAGYAKGRLSNMPWMLRDITYQVYFIQAVAGGPVKIGRSGDPRKRLRQLQTSHPERLAIVGILEGSESLERDLHQRFSHLRLEGEWFSLDRELIEFIQNIKGAA